MPDDQPPRSDEPGHDGAGADAGAGAGADLGADAGADSDTGARSSGAGWTAPTLTTRREQGDAQAGRDRAAFRRSLAALVAMTTLGAAGWYGSGLYLETRARQEAADAWDAARVCLLGDGLRASMVPSERLRLITMAVGPHRTPPDGEDAWPARCRPQAERLDRALAARTLRRQLGELDALTPLTTADEPLKHAERLDRLHAELEVADLPRPHRDPTTSSSVPAAPAPARPRLARTDLASLGRAESLAHIDVAFDPQRGTSLRLLLPEAQPVVCRFNDGPRGERWQSAACRPTPLELPEGARVLLTTSTPGAPDLLRVRDADSHDGFYDGTTGQRLLRPRYFDAQAVMRDDGHADLLYADLGGEGIADRVERFRLMRAVPGRRPKRHRLALPPEARVKLEPERVLWWVAEHPSDDQRFSPRDALFTNRLGASPDEPILEKRERVGELPLDSRLVGSCTSRATRATLFAAGLKERRLTLLFERDGKLQAPLDVGPIAGAPALSCDGDHAILTRKLGRVASTWRCKPEGCVPANAGPLPPEVEASSGPPPLAEVAPIGDRLALAWSSDGEPLRLRVEEADDLHAAEDQIVFDDELHGGLEPVALRWLTAEGLAVLLIQDVGRRVYALRVTEGGKISPVRVAR